jgi:hypothetical protein
MMAEEGHELEGKAPRAQHPALKIRSKIEILVGLILLRKNRRDEAACSAQVSEKLLSSGY